MTKDINVESRTLGVSFNKDGQANIQVWSPTSKSVSILVSESKQTLSLEKGSVGYWELVTNELKPGDLYKFILDEDKQRPDPASVSQPEGVHGFSQAVDLTYPWTDAQWINPPLKDYILYELHTGTFSDHGGFEGIEEHLDHLVNLGVNAIEIMPVAQFPGDRNWGYDGVYPFAVQSSYGGPKGLQKLVDTCHAKGIAVVLDVVYNHMGPEGNYFNDFGPYFTDKYNTPWGNAINFDDCWCDGVREYFIENVLMWFRDFHVDALRLDAVHAIKDFSARHILSEMRLYTDQLMKATGHKHHLIVELDLNDNRYINPLAQHGFGMDAQWIDEFHHALRVTATNETTGYYSDFSGIEHLAKAYKDAYVYDGIYSPHRLKTFGCKADTNPGSQFIVFSQNHDQVGNRMLGERTSELVSFEMLKLLAASVMVAPYIPMLFMGEEYGETNPFLYFVSHTDAELAEAVRKGRKAEFAAFHNEGEAPDPVAMETFDKSKLQWNLLNVQPHKTLLEWYRFMIALRKSDPVLSNLDKDSLRATANQADNTLVLLRWNGEQKLLCLFNFSTNPIDFSITAFQRNNWHKVADSAAVIWNGPRDAPDDLSSLSSITLQPESILIYSNVNT